MFNLERENVQHVSQQISPVGFQNKFHRKLGIG